MLSGDDWYFLEATRAVNQAIGRVIRHKNDYGAILLCDQRFNQQRQKSQLSSWIQGHLKAPQHNSFGPLIAEVSRFFRNAERTVRTYFHVPSNSLLIFVKQFQLPTAQLKPLLPCDINSASSMNVSQPSSSSSRPTQETITHKQPIKIKKEVTNEVSRANSVYSFEAKIYSQVLSPVKTEKNAAGSNVFLSGLDNQVKVI